MHGADTGIWGQIMGVATLALLFAAPVLLGLIGLTRRGPPSTPAPFDTALAANSAILYALAFNVTFFVQELFLVLPKALTPGLQPTLFHNNHSWTGDNPIARLFQGTGALSILITGLAFFALMRALPRGVPRLFAFWMAYHGLLQSLPQLGSVPFAPETDVGQALTYLQLTPLAKLVLALLALVAIVIAGLALGRAALTMAATPERVATARSRTAYIVTVALIPALIGGLLILPFRWPTSVPNLVMPSLLVGWFGVSWMLASAWLHTNARAEGAPMRISWIAVGALIALLAIFQSVLRPGVPFY